VLKLISGTLVTVVDTGGRDLNFDGFSENRPVVLDPSVLFTSLDEPNSDGRLLPRTAFRSATTADFGGDILGRNTFFLDGVANLDLGLVKNVALPWSGQRLTVRLELFNALNHAQFGFPIVDYASSTFSSVTSTATIYRPRTLQLALRYSY